MDGVWGRMDGWMEGRNGMDPLLEHARFSFISALALDDG